MAMKEFYIKFNANTFRIRLQQTMDPIILSLQYLHVGEYN